MHFMASPDVFTAAYERILFTKQFSGTASIYCAVPQPHRVWHKHCCVGRWASMPALESNRNATNQISLEFCAADRSLVHCSMCFGAYGAPQRRVLISNAALAETVRGDEQWTYS